MKNNETVCVTMDKMNYTTFNNIYSNWFQRKDSQKLPRTREIKIKFFHSKFFLGFENNIEARPIRIFCFVIKARLNLTSVKKYDTYLFKGQGEKFPAQNVIKMKETIQYQRSAISDK